MRQFFAVAVVFGICFRGSTALYSSSGPVKLVTKKTFASEIVESDLPSVVEFFAPWCGHCKQLTPIYKKVAENLQGIANVAAVDCDEASNKPLCGQYGVQGFPTLKLFSADKEKNPYTKKFEKTPSDYNGPRTAKAIADAVLAQLPDTFITTVRGAANFGAFKAASQLPKVVLASAKPKATPLYKSLSLRFKGRLAFAAVRDTDSEVVEALGTSAFPALVVIPPDGELVHYEGKLRAQELIDFLSQHAGSAPTAEDVGGKTSKKTGKAGAARDPEADDEGPDDKDKVVPQELSLEALEALVNEEDAWLVAFFTGTECDATLAGLNKAVSELGPLIKAGAVNLTGEEAAAKGASYGVDAAALSASPCALDIALAPFDDKGDPAEWQRYTGELGSPKELQRFVLEAFPSMVTRISAATLHAFVGKDALAPTVLLFTDKDETPGVFAALSVNLRKYRYRFADAHSSDAQLMQQFNIKKVPSMVITYVKPGTEVKAGENVPVGLQQYPGPLKYPFMHSFLSTFAGMMGAQPEGEEDDLSSFLEGQGKGGGGGPVEVPEAASDADLERLCGAKSGLCAVALLDTSDQAFQGHLGTWKEAAGKWAKQPLHFLWVDAARQGGFLAGFGLSRAALPSAVAFSPKKLRGAALTGAYSAQSVQALLDGLFSGRVHTTRFQEMPRLVEGGEEEPVMEEPVEEEFDLADVLGEEVGGSGSKEELLRKAEQELEEEEAKRRAAEEQARSKAAGSKKKGGKKKRKAAAKAAPNEEL